LTPPRLLGLESACGQVDALMARACTLDYVFWVLQTGMLLVVVGRWSGGVVRWGGEMSREVQSRSAPIAAWMSGFWLTESDAIELINTVPCVQVSHVRGV
jgi:hypothetical protein